VRTPSRSRTWRCFAIARFLRLRHPGPEDVLLVVEVAETSADADRSLKIPLYARYGIPEAWLVDLLEERIEIYRHPTPQGYRSLTSPTEVKP
jgi:Uma2 family endonuclease